MRQIFKDAKLEKDFNQNGYVVIPGLFREKELAFFQQVHERFSNHPNSTFSTSHWSKDEDYRSQIHEALNTPLSKKIQPFLQEYKSVYSYFLVKYPGKGGEVTLHQDWTLVDEEKFRGVTAWCPLVDVHQKNGWFQVLKASHRIFGNTRGSNFEFPYGGEMRTLIEEKYLEGIEMKAGDLLLFDQRLVHASPPNFSDAVRIAVGHVLIPAETTMVHYYKKSAEQKAATLYETGDEFLLKFAFGDQPLSEFIEKGQAAAIPHKYTLQEFTTIYNRYNSNRKYFSVANWFRKRLKL